jgi:hypothetical protein
MVFAATPSTVRQALRAQGVLRLGATRYPCVSRGGTVMRCFWDSLWGVLRWSVRLNRVEASERGGRTEETPSGPLRLCRRPRRPAPLWVSRSLPTRSSDLRRELFSNAARRAACARSGLAEKLVHDMRRPANRDFEGTEREPLGLDGDERARIRVRPIDDTTSRRSRRFRKRAKGSSDSRGDRSAQAQGKG